MSSLAHEASYSKRKSVLSAYTKLVSQAYPYDWFLTLTVGQSTKQYPKRSARLTIGQESFERWLKRFFRDHVYRRARNCLSWSRRDLAKCSSYVDPVYVMGFERQRNGRLHAHVLVWFPVFETIPRYAEIRDFWSEHVGYAWVEHPRSMDKVCRYVSKYSLKGDNCRGDYEANLIFSETFGRSCERVTIPRLVGLEVLLGSRRAGGVTVTRDRARSVATC